ncbi:MAG: TIR domain-containing protein, partial [bacterium]|nr:TIR domain-containing protein [bacterium]
MAKQQDAPVDRILGLEALEDADYCLLLWSKAARASVYVQAEWQAALQRTLTQTRRFLLIGRLEPEPLPQLLSPRLYLDLFPDLACGLAQLTDTLTRDARAATAGAKPVAPSLLPPAAPSGTEVYVSSELFRITLPFPVELGAPAGQLLDAFVHAHDLPTRVMIAGTV